MSPMPPKFAGVLITEPRLIDFLHVCHNAMSDVRDDYEAMQGRAWDPEIAALEFANRTAPRWCVTSMQGEPLAIGGFTWIRSAVWQDWLLSTPQAWSNFARPLTRVCRTAIDELLRDAQRVQCLTLAERPRARAWYRLMGYEHEATLRAFCADRRDAVIYSRVRK